ncbi:HTH domain-containing protein [Billgrantia diversa]|uniref:HTH domain-containing protein n=1 Tax=Halomonas sp. MCCC 1A13316 TaxID=2733487 RepID=UPI0018D460D0
MSRTTRLFDLMQTLRRHRRPVSGTVLADELGVSLRTLYRDIAALKAIGAEIEGEAGLGYVLKPGLLLPPLMFSEEELEAVALGLVAQACRFLAHPEHEVQFGCGKYETVVETLANAVAGRRYIAGDTFTAADVYVSSHSGWGMQFGTLERRPEF